MSAAHRSAGTAAWIPPTAEELTQILPQYHIEKLLGHGGMGAVYLGEQTALERKVAIKILPEEMAHDPAFFARFRREARTLAKLQHPGIVTVHDFGQTGAGHPYFVMQYVEGTDLRHVLRGPGLKPEQAYQLIGEVCEALHYAHRQGVIHRDIKPANVLIDLEGRVKLADFGLARPPAKDEQEITGTDQILGTPSYMAPEQHEGVSDRRSDIFALGVMLYEMLTGTTPRGAFDPPSHRVQVDVRIDEVVLKALQQKPERRYQEASEMKTDVERISRSPTRFGLSGNGRLALAAGLLLVIVPGALYLWPAHRTAPAPPDSALSPAEAAPQPRGPELPVSATPPLASRLPVVYTPPPPAPEGVAPVTNSLGMKFVPVPGTKALFCTTPTRLEDFRAFADATNYHDADHAPLVTETHITSEGGSWRNPGFLQAEDHPVLDINIRDARAFCRWLSEKEHRLYRLPTDAEWSWAVGIGHLEDPTLLPGQKHTRLQGVFAWGREWPPPPDAGNFRDAGSFMAWGPNPDFIKGWADGYLYTSPVTRFRPNYYGLFDMAANVSQVVEDTFGVNSETRRAGDFIARGNAWSSGDPVRAQASYRYPLDERRATFAGFRCVLDPAGSPDQPPAPRIETVDCSRAMRVGDYRFVRGSEKFPVSMDDRWIQGSVYGEYQLLHRQPGTEWPLQKFQRAQPLLDLHLADFACEVRARIVTSSKGGWGLGLMHRQLNDGLEAGVMVDGKGRVASQSYLGNIPTGNPVWTEAPSMHPISEWNTLWIEAKGTRIRVFVNGVFVFERQHPRRERECALCLYCFGEGAPQDIRFDSVEVFTL
jgi:predicted Ser/Thr protein kinase